MKKLMMAAVAAMFVVSANAADAAKTAPAAPAAPATEQACKDAKGTWDAKANNGAGACTLAAPAAPAKK